MNADFQKLLTEIERLHGELMAMKPVKRGELGLCKFPGVYLFSEGRRHLYCGRCKRPLSVRLLEHARISVAAAPFAFRLARIQTGRLKASYRADGDSRAQLMKDETFRAAFKAAVERISKMDIRYVRADDPTTQALLEIYTSTVLKTPHNEFKTT